MNETTNEIEKDETTNYQCPTLKELKDRNFETDLKALNLINGMLKSILTSENKEIMSNKEGSDPAYIMTVATRLIAWGYNELKTRAQPAYTWVEEGLDVDEDPKFTFKDLKSLVEEIKEKVDNSISMIFSSCDVLEMLNGTPDSCVMIRRIVNSIIDEFKYYYDLMDQFFDQKQIR